MINARILALDPGISLDKASILALDPGIIVLIKPASLYSIPALSRLMPRSSARMLSKSGVYLIVR